MTVARELPRANRALCRVFLALVAVPGIMDFASGPPALAQIATPSVGAQPMGSGVVVGQVVDASGGSPIPGALVTLGASAPPSTNTATGRATGSAPGRPEQVIANGEGRFVFHDLPRGQVTLSASAAGYMPGGFGQRRMNGPVQPIDLATSRDLPEAIIRLWKLAVMGGRVLDDFGEPMVSVGVHLVQETHSAGTRRFVQSATTTTDDRGVFRFASLVPGDYLIAVPSVSTSIPTSVVDEHATAYGRVCVYESTFYPNAVTSAQAEVITLGSGEARSGLDVTLPLVPTTTVSGSVRGPGGQAINVDLHLVPADTDDWASENGYETAHTVTGGQGAFTFRGVPAGLYVVKGAQAGLWAQAPVSVGDTAVTGVSVVLHDTLSVSGHLDFQGGSARPAPQQLQQLSVSLASAGARGTGPALPGRVAADGQFTASGYQPGSYIVNAPMPGGPWTLRSIMLDGRDLLRAPLPLDVDTAGLVVTYTDRPSQLAGTVQLTAGQNASALVVVFPADYQSATDAGTMSHLSRTAGPGAAGQFTVQGLPPGDYLVAAIPGDFGPEWMEPDVIGAIALQATRVSIGEGERRTVDLRKVIVR